MEEVLDHSNVIEADDRIISELVSFQRVHVVSDIQWDKLQSILRSVCTQISVQASRLDKYEEQGKWLANSLNELGDFCKNSIEELKEAKGSEDKEKEDWKKMIEERIQSLQEGLDATNNNMNQQMNSTSGLQSRMEILLSLPQRVDSLEEIMKNAPNKYLRQDSFQELHAKGDLGGGDVVHDNGNGEDNGEILVDPFETLQGDLADHNDRLHLLEDQIADLKELLKQTTKAHASDYEALQNICRNLRSDFEMKPILDVKNTECAGRIPSQDEKSALEEAILELQNRLQRKADAESMDLLSRLAHKNKDKIEKLRMELQAQVKSPPQSSRRGSNSQEMQPKLFEGNLLECRIKKVEDDLIGLATQLAAKAERNEIDNLQFQVTLLGTNQQEPIGINEHDTPGSHEYDNVQTDQAVGTLSGMQMNDEPVEVSPRGSTAVDPNGSTVVDSDESGLQSGGELIMISGQSNQNVQSKCGSQNRRESGIPNLALQKLQELIGRKADRDEVHQLYEIINRQRITPMESTTSSDDMEALQEELRVFRTSIEDLNDAVDSLRERSDLSVLISKRIENISEPPATIQDARHANEVLQAVINDHAQRLMEYGDLLLQIEVLVASKVDASGLEGLKELLAGFQNRRKTRMESMRTCTSNDQNQGPPLNLSGNYPSMMSNASQEKLESHEYQLNQLLKDVEMLGEGLLIMSGHHHSLSTQDGSCEELQNGSNNLICGADEHPSYTTLASNKEKIESRFDDLQSISEDQCGNALPTRSESNTVERDHATLSGYATDGSSLLVALKKDLKDNKLKSKSDTDNFVKLVEDLHCVSSKIEQLFHLLADIQDALEHKADKADLQKVARYVKQRVERAETAMLSGKALGFKCMSCDHPLEKLNPNRAEFLPTNYMPKQTLPMNSAGRLYAHERESGDSTWSSTSGVLDGTSLVVDIPRNLPCKQKQLKGKK